jgi:hypothetical protein
VDIDDEGVVHIHDEDSNNDVRDADENDDTRNDG